VKSVAPDDFALLLDEPDPDVVQVPLEEEDDDVDELNRGLTVIVVLLMHWSEGKSVALLLNVMSAHFYHYSQLKIENFESLNTYIVEPLTILRVRGGKLY
jgi:hypothetical protein